MSIREQLEKIMALRKEIEALQKRIDKEESRVVSDVVTGSGNVFPYVERRVHIRGVSKKAKNLRRKLQILAAEYWEAWEQAMEAVMDIEESEIRLIILLRYFDGRSWREVGEQMCYPDESTPRKKLNRYLEVVNE